jgi:hypothetical protein
VLAFHRCSLVAGTVVAVMALVGAASSQKRAEDATAVGGAVIAPIDFKVPQPTVWDPAILPGARRATQWTRTITV